MSAILYGNIALIREYVFKRKNEWIVEIYVNGRVLSKFKGKANSRSNKRLYESVIGQLMKIAGDRLLNGEECNGIDLKEVDIE